MSVKDIVLSEYVFETVTMMAFEGKLIVPF
jgi:hypothetical protein